MSQENVEVLRSVYDAYARRDSITPFKAYAPDIEWDLTGLAHLDGATVYHGYEGVRAGFRDLLSAFRDFQFQPEELRDAGDRVLATVHEHGVGRASGIIVDRRHYALWTFREGKIVRLRVYLDRNEALEAAGLSE